MENTFNAFAFFFPENTSSTFFVSTAGKSDLSCQPVPLFPPVLEKDYLRHVKQQKCSTETMRV